MQLAHQVRVVPAFFCAAFTIFLTGVGCDYDHWLLQATLYYTVASILRAGGSGRSDLTAAVVAVDPRQCWSLPRM